ncbi:hypothetical protein NMY22_g16573 [Coprinellus aureogranulatus]|nr:hypothetical protein NMY22_g16573 [Coprinellus aureogranulatus]
MPPPWFPQEVIDQIIDWAAQDTPESLRALRLTSRRFVERTRRHIYFNMDFADPQWISGETWRILKNDPSLFKHVRKMTFCERLPGFKVSKEEFQEVLGHLDLRALVIDVVGIYKRWKELEVPTRWPQLVYLSIKLKDYAMSCKVFYSLPHLRELRLTYRSYARPLWKPAAPTVGKMPWKLKSLHYDHDGDEPSHNRRLRLVGSDSGEYIRPMRLLVNPAWEPQVYGELVHLSLIMHRHEHQRFAFSRILPLCERSGLKTLRLQYGSFPGRTWMDVRAYSVTPFRFRSTDVSTVKDFLADCERNNRQLPSFTSLEYLSLCLRSDQWDRRSDLHPIPPHAANLASTILGVETQPSLEAMELTFSWTLTPPLDRGEPLPSPAELSQKDLVVPGPEWARLEAILLDRLRFPQLRAIRIKMHVTDHMHRKSTDGYRSSDNSALGRALQEQLLSAMPQVRDSGLIVDVGRRDTQQAFDRIAKAKLATAWCYE